MNCYHDTLAQDSFCDELCPICLSAELRQANALLWALLPAVETGVLPVEGRRAKLCREMKIHLTGDYGDDDGTDEP